MRPSAIQVSGMEPHTSFLPPLILCWEAPLGHVGSPLAGRIGLQFLSVVSLIPERQRRACSWLLRRWDDSSLQIVMSPLWIQDLAWAGTSSLGRTKNLNVDPQTAVPFVLRSHPTLPIPPLLKTSTAFYLPVTSLQAHLRDSGQEQVRSTAVFSHGNVSWCETQKRPELQTWVCEILAVWHGPRCFSVSTTG